MIQVSSDDFGGLQFVGPIKQARNTAAELRRIIDEADGVPNFISDFVFDLEVACGEVEEPDDD